MRDTLTQTQQCVVGLFLRLPNQGSPPHTELCVKGKSGEWHRFASRGEQVISGMVGGPGEESLVADLDRLDAENDHAGIVFCGAEFGTVSILEG